MRRQRRLILTSKWFKLSVQYNTIQILLSTPHGGLQRQILIVETIKTNKQTKNTQELLINNNITKKHLLLHIGFMPSQIDYQ